MSEEALVVGLAFVAGFAFILTVLAMLAFDLMTERDETMSVDLERLERLANGAPAFVPESADLIREAAAEIREQRAEVARLRGKLEAAERLIEAQANWMQGDEDAHPGIHVATVKEEKLYAEMVEARAAYEEEPCD